MYKYICDECGAEFERSAWKPKGKRFCNTHAYKHVEDAAQQLMNRSGPYYEKWREAMRRNASRATEGIRRYLEKTS